MKSINTCIAALVVLAAPSVHAACFTVFDAVDRVVYQSTEPPIDISQPVSQGLAAAYPKGYHLLMSDNSYCPGFGEPSNTYDAPLPGSRLPGSGAPALQLAEAGMSRYRGLDAPDPGADWTPPGAGHTPGGDLGMRSESPRDDTVTQARSRAAAKRAR